MPIENGKILTREILSGANHRMTQSGGVGREKEKGADKDRAFYKIN